MKLLTRPCLIVLAVVVATLGAGVWLDWRKAPIQEGDVVIDAAFLQRFKADRYRTSREPAIKALWDTCYTPQILADGMKAGAVKISLHHLADGSVEVTVRENPVIWMGSIRSHLRRHRATTWALFSPRWWRREVLHRPYWDTELDNFTAF